MKIILLAATYLEDITGDGVEERIDARVGNLSPNFHCFHHEWGLHPSYATDNGGKNGGNVGGKMAMSPVCP